MKVFKIQDYIFTNLGMESLMVVEHQAWLLDLEIPPAEHLVDQKIHLVGHLEGLKILDCEVPDQSASHKNEADWLLEAPVFIQ